MGQLRGQSREFCLDLSADLGHHRDGRGVQCGEPVSGAPYRLRSVAKYRPAGCHAHTVAVEQIRRAGDCR
jgi:hypothetical protein